MSSSVLFVLSCLVVLHTVVSLDLLDPPQTIRGSIWQDWNGNGVREAYEPGFPHVTVRLFYQPSGDTNFIIGGESNVIDSQSFFTLSDGQFYFSCLTSGNYSVQIELPESRPATFSPATSDSDITDFSGRIGTTGFFIAQAGNVKEINAGAIQYGFINLFPMTGRENVPTEPDVTLGTTYSVFDARKNALYYRIERGPWKQYNFEDVRQAGFYKGAPGQNGDRVRSLADPSSVKTNVWSNISSENIKLFYAGKIFVNLFGNGSHSDNSRLRGNWNPFYNSKYVKAHLTLSGENVVPSPVSTLAIGTLDLHYSFDGDNITYELHLEQFGRAQINQISLYGPADVNSVGPNLGVQLHEGRGSVNVSKIDDFSANFFTNKVYVQVTSDQYPNGHIRAQINQFSQVVYYTTSYYSKYGTAENYLKLALALDTVKHTLSYYTTIEVSESAIYVALMFNIPGLELQTVPITAFKSGVWVGQGFFWNLSPEQEQSILNSQGESFNTDLVVGVSIDGGNFYGFDYMYPRNWY